MRRKEFYRRRPLDRLTFHRPALSPPHAAGDRDPGPPAHAHDHPARENVFEWERLWVDLGGEG